MRTLIISILIILTTLFSLIPASAQSTEETASEEPTQAETTEISTAAEPNSESASDMNSADDPNVIRTRVESFEGLNEELRNLDMDGKEELREWTRRNDERLELLQATQKQTTEELKFLRKLAAEEGAEKTTAAIDVILLDRQERYKPILERLEKEKERLRRAEEREERSRERERPVRERPTRSR